MDRFHRRLLWPIRVSRRRGHRLRRTTHCSTTTRTKRSTSTPRRPCSTRSRRCLFGLDHAKRDIAKGHQAVVVEGYTDVMAMHLRGSDHRRGLLRHRVRRRTPGDAAATHDGRQLLSRRTDLRVRRRRRWTCSGGQGLRRASRTWPDSRSSPWPPTAWTRAICG